MSTIFALSSGIPPAAIAVVRVSGPGAGQALTALGGGLPRPRRAELRTLRASDGAVLDQALLLWFPGPASATGDDVAELHLHGGRATVAAVEAELAAIPGLRRAEPGEFTRRALLNGRIDLSQAEGLGDLLLAETEAQRRAALASVEGAVGRAVEGWVELLLALAARTEALLDFADEEDVGSTLENDLRNGIGALAGEMAAVLSNPSVERLRDGVRVVLGGPPNSGKSTLFNVLADRDAAIVSPIAGTTRDLVEAQVLRAGRSYVLVDTAGLTDATDDPIETIGVDRARRAAEQADVLLWLGDVSPPAHPGVLWICPRADQADAESRMKGRVVAVSARTGVGVKELWRAIDTQAQALLPRPDRLALNVRQHRLCSDARSELEQGARCDDLLLAAEHLRTARRSLDAVTGGAAVDDMLDALFSRFCIGK